MKFHTRKKRRDSRFGVASFLYNFFESVHTNRMSKCENIKKCEPWKTIRDREECVFKKPKERSRNDEGIL